MAAKDRLAEYIARRNFAKTDEPAGGLGRRKRTKLGFFVQKHDARRLHYDLRLEWDGVLLSWAVTRGPSPDPGQKRLAVRTEDHPLSYGNFEGTIPKKEYGEGTVMLWDQGTWESQQQDPERALQAGKLSFIARGARMRGGWVLVRMRRRTKEKRENWLLIKERDDQANDDPDALTRHYITSIASERTMQQIANAAAARTSAAQGRKKKKTAKPRRKASRKHVPPPFVKPQLATLTADVPGGTDWIHESKFDGYRCLVAVGGGGLRQDKKPVEVTMEKTADKAKASSGDNQELHGIRLTHPDRVVFQDQGVSKADLAGYYEAVAHRMLPLMQSHPLSLVRCPKGVDDKCFFQKHASDGFPDALKRISIAESDGDTAEYLYVDDVAGLIAGVQMGTLEFHIWGSRIDRLEKPDRLVFDLDPDPQLDFEVVRLAANVVRDRLADIGLQSLAMVTGGKGLHVVAPLRRTADWQTVKSFAKAFAKSMAAAHPDAFTATLSKSQRHGKIFVDWLRNERGATAVAPYSSRARQNAPVATPVGWKELGKIEAANTFRLHDVVQRLGRPDPWATYREISQSLTRKMLDSIS